MHARPTSALCIVSVICFAGLAGCRNGKSVSSYVQVEVEPSAEVPPIDPPPQRLATGRNPPADDPSQTERSTTDSDRNEGSPEKKPTTEIVRVSTTSDSVTQAKRTPKTSAGSRRDSQASAKFSISDRRTRSEETANGSKPSKPAKHRPTHAPARQRSERIAQAKSETEATDMPPADRVTRSANAGKRNNSKSAKPTSPRKDAYTDSPPDVQQEALRQLLAMAASRAEDSAQPSSIDELLKQAMENPIDLPEPRRTPPEVQPTRIATTDARSDPQKPKTKPVDTSVEEDETKIASSDGDTEPKAESDDVRPASAARAESDADSVSHATELSGQDENATVQSAVAKVSSALLSDEALFNMLIGRLKTAEPGESEADRYRREIMIRHLMVMAGKPDEAVQDIEQLSEREQEYLSHQLMGLWTIIDPQGHPVPSRRFSSALPRIREATKHLAASTDSLDVKSLAFCTAIESYGQIKPFKQYKFAPEQQVILYCEIENFTAKRLDEGYETHLHGSYTVYDAENRKVLNQALPSDRQVSANYLRDFYIAYQMPIPRQLTAGSYRLELTMEDIHGRKYGQASIDFDVTESPGK